jgi:hypothetical protein
MGGLHITLPMRSDTQEQILAYLRQDAPIEVADAEPTHVLAYAEPTRVSLPPTKPKLSAAPIKPKLSAAPIKPESEQPKVVVDDTSFDARFTAVWAGATNVLGPSVIPWAERSYAGVLDPN